MKTVRIIFSKTGRAKYVSHLDLMRTMTRALRRAAIPLWYTEGFNRHPYLTFAAPLSLGYEGLRESMDIRMEDDMSYAEVVDRLNAVLPEGMVAVEASEAQAKVKELTAAEYRLAFNCSAGPVKELLSKPEILVEKRTKKKTMKTIDIHPYFASAAVETVGEDRCVMSVTLSCGSAENINPGLFVTSLGHYLDAPVEAEVQRQRLLKSDGGEFL